MAEATAPFKAKYNLEIPPSVLTDSYKASHFAMYPEAQVMSAYGEFRRGYDKDKEDTRFIWWGFRFYLEKFIGRQWTAEDVEKADAFYKTHNAGYQEYPFPKDLFLKFVNENNGYFPVRIEALPEGTVANAHVPVYQIFAEGEYSRLVTFLETITTQAWYPCTVATLSRRCKDIIEEAFVKSVDDELQFLLASRLHDFGFRGATCPQQAIIGGCAHLLNFEGSDTMPAAYTAQYGLNGGKPVATSIPATEHSVMTSWKTERAAISNMIKNFGGEGKLFACVMDSYHYQNALDKVLPSLKEEHINKGGLLVLRPDSGDPVDMVLRACQAGEKHFGATVNKKGFKCLNSVAVIQGDGINIHTVKDILAAVLEAGYSAQNIAFGMGAGLLQKINRDTMSFATKLNYIVYADGVKRDVMKRPLTDSGKISLPGVLKVVRDPSGGLSIVPRDPEEKQSEDNVLQVIWDSGPVETEDITFDEMRKRVDANWKACPKTFDPISAELQKKIDDWGVAFEQAYKDMMAEFDAAEEGKESS